MFNLKAINISHSLDKLLKTNSIDIDIKHSQACISLYEEGILRDSSFFTLSIPASNLELHCVKSNIKINMFGFNISCQRSIAFINMFINNVYDKFNASIMSTFLKKYYAFYEKIHKKKREILKSTNDSEANISADNLDELGIKNLNSSHGKVCKMILKTLLTQTFHINKTN